MKFLLTLKRRWTELTAYLLAQDVPPSTKSVADGVQGVLTTILLTPLRILATLPPRLLILATAIAVLLLGVWIISMFLRS